MVDLPLRQSIDYQAGLAFANLAPREARPRRRAGSRRRISPTISNTIPRRAPIGTPTRLAPNEQFSHIQIIPRPESSEDEADSLPQPMFRSNPLGQEVDLHVKGPQVKQLAMSGSTDSLANHYSGTTFAAKARAAELNAARARWNQGNENAKPGVSPEPVKLIKHRARPNRAWKPFDLSGIPEDVSDIDIDGGNSEKSSPEKSGTGQGIRSKDYSYFDGSVLKRPYSADTVVDTVKSHDFPQLSRSGSADPELSPDSKKLVESVFSYDASEWDSDLPGKDVTSSRPLSRVASSHESSDVHGIPVDQSEVVLSVSQRNKNDLQIDQDTSIGVTPVHQSSILPCLFETPKTPSPQPAPYSPISPVKFTVDPNNDPFSENTIRIPQSRQPSDHYDLEVPKYIIPKNIPHRYPAVKGTIDYQCRFPQPPILAHDPYGRYQQRGQVSDTRSGFWSSTSSHELETPYRRLSAEDKKNLLAQQLADIESQQTGSSKSTRTVLHDPVATAGTQAQLTTPVQAPGSPQPETEFAKMSDPLPWKNRPVDVITTPGLSLIEPAPQKSNNTRGHKMTIGEEQALRAAQSLADAESWWRRDNRIDLNAAKGIDNFIDGCKKEYSDAKKARAREAAAQLAQRRDEFPDDWSEKSYSTEVPEASNAADVSDKLLIPVLKNLSVYMDMSEKGYFSKFGRVHDWAIDSSHAGQQSFFEKDWGKPPARVGRDPRYRPMLHDGRYTIFEDLGGRGNGRRFR